MMKNIQQRPFRAGLIINPYAGIGGEAALKGSDSMRDAALAYSSRLRTPGRAARFVAALGDALPQVQWYCGGGLMGEQVLQAAGCPVHYVQPVAELTSAEDTRRLALSLKSQVDLLLFVGGDGTARDIVDMVGEALPCLGIPGGVKMQSAVFALSPEAAADIVIACLHGKTLSSVLQDVRDIDEQALRSGKVRSRYYGSLLVPGEAQRLQRLKQGGVENNALVLDEIADHLSELMHECDTVMLAGPGSTIDHWMREMGLANTLIGFDAVKDGELLQSDLTGRDILALLDQYPDLQLVISPTGGQGFLLGRGNQQLSADVIRRLDKSQWLVVAARSKLDALEGRPLLVDSNDPELDHQLSGLYPVVTAYRQQMLYPVNIAYRNNTDV